MAEFLARRDRDDVHIVSTNDAESLSHDPSPKLFHIALPDRFISHGDIPNLYKEVGFDEEAVAGKVREAWRM